LGQTLPFFTINKYNLLSVSAFAALLPLPKKIKRNESENKNRYRR